MNNLRLSRHNNSRLIFIFIIFVFLYAVASVNLFVIQIRKNDYFKSLGDQQYNINVTIKPKRAIIYDRNDIPMALNKEILSAFIVPNQLNDSENLKKFLFNNFRTAYERLIKHPNSQFLYIKRNLDNSDIDKIRSSNLSDIKFLNEPSRYYPIASIGPVIGITDIDNQGISGIELLYNNLLSGKPTTHRLEKDARSGRFYFKHETKVPGTEAKPIKLTIDSVLQFLTYEELKETVINLGSKEGSALIINPENGDILAMVNYPDFDPNNIKDLDLNLTKNRIITDAYELGSVIKSFLALAALEEKVVTPDELIDCGNSKFGSVNGIKFTTWKAHGIIPFSEVMQGSNNFGVAKIALRLGSKLYDHYNRLGFGKKINIFPGENKGFITPPNKWSRASIISLSFGYEISGTILQLAQAAGIIANNGYLVKPRLILNDKNPEKIGPLYSPESIKQLKEILKKYEINGCQIMGKTGTARLITNGKYDPNRTIFTFFGIIEKENYKRIIITFIKETNKTGVYASSIAFPLFEQIAQKMLIHDKIYD